MDAYGDRLPADVLMRLGTTRFRSGLFINGVSLSPDGKTLAVATGNQVIRLVEVATGTELKQVPLPQYSPGPLHCTADGKSFLIRTGNNSFQLLDGNGKIQGKVVAPSSVSGRAFVSSADDKVVTWGAQGLGGQKANPSAWDLATGKQLAYAPS